MQICEHLDSEHQYDPDESVTRCYGAGTFESNGAPVCTCMQGETDMADLVTRIAADRDGVLIEGLREYLSATRALIDALAKLVEAV